MSLSAQISAKSTKQTWRWTPTEKKTKSVAPGHDPVHHAWGRSESILPAKRLLGKSVLTQFSIMHGKNAEHEMGVNSRLLWHFGEKFNDNPDGQDHPVNIEARFLVGCYHVKPVIPRSCDATIKACTLWN